MFCAYVKPINIGTELEKIEFTSTKARCTNMPVILESHVKGPLWYNIKGSTYLFHASWLDNLTDCDEVFGICEMINPERTRYVYRIVKMNIENVIIDIKSGQPITWEINQTYDIHSWVRNDRHKIDYLISHDVSNGQEYLRRCAKCNKEYFMFCSESQLLCCECWIGSIAKCAKCGTKFEYTENNHIKLAGKSQLCWLCSDCLVKNYRQCDTCSQYVSTGSARVIEGKNYCYGCIERIESNSIDCCTSCGEFFFKSSKVLSKRNGKNICCVCDIDRRVPTQHRPSGVLGTIRDYNYKPHPIFHGESNIGLYYGMEIEVVTFGMREPVAKYLQFFANEESDMLYCKFDRSIGNDGMAGFEIVTHPCSFDWFGSEEGTNVIKRILDIKTYNCEAFRTNTCGMHIHISKTAFNSSHLYRFLSMIYNNQGFSKFISERTDLTNIQTYSSYTPFDDLKKMSKEMSNPHSREARHRAVNLSCPNTVEVRIFKSTLEYERIMKNIEYCHSLYDFTKNNEQITVPNYISYVAENKSYFPNLHSFIKTMK